MNCYIRALDDSNYAECFKLYWTLPSLLLFIVINVAILVVGAIITIRFYIEFWIQGSRLADSLFDYLLAPPPEPFTLANWAGVPAPA